MRTPMMVIEVVDQEMRVIETADLELTPCKTDTDKLMEIEKMLRENNIWADVYEELSMIAVEINWGDWKHEHLAAKWLMKELGYEQEFERVTEENGSDTYSAIHYFLEA